MKATKNNVIVEPIIPEKRDDFFLPTYLKEPCASQYGVVIATDGQEETFLQKGDVVVFERFKGARKPNCIWKDDEKDKWLMKICTDDLLGFIR